MKINENTVDRIVRVALGVMLLAMVVAGPKTMWGWLGIIPLVTGLVGYCPIYRVLGVDTCRFERTAG